MRATQTTTHLKLPRVRLDLPPAASLTIITFCVICIVALVGRIQSSTPSAIAVATPPLPIIIIASPLPVVPRLVAPAGQQVAAVPAAPRFVVAFAAPDGVALGAIPEPALSAITGRWGDTWLSTTHEGATVWVRSADLGANLANLAPVPQVVVQPVYVAAPQAPEPYQTDSEPAQAEQPAPAAPTPEPQPVDQRTIAIQAHYANEQQPAAVQQQGGYQDTPVQREWNRTEWRAEHCTGDVCVP